MSESTTHPRTGNTIRSPRIVAKRQHVRDRILATSGRLFAERGPAATSVKEILAEAEISRRTFYGFFASKYELVASLINPLLEEGAELLTAVANQPPARAVPGIVDCYLQLWASHREALSVIALLSPDVMPYIDEQHRRFGATLKRVLKSAEQAGMLRNDSAQLTFRVITKTAVPLLKIYADEPDGEQQYRAAMLALLGNDD